MRPSSSGFDGRRRATAARRDEREARVDVELAAGALDVADDGLMAERQLLGNLAIREAVGDSRPSSRSTGVTGASSSRTDSGCSKRTSSNPWAGA
jgi:hypothetical protein